MTLEGNLQENGENSRVLKAVGNHAYLTITLRLMLVEIIKSLFYIYMYEVSSDEIGNGKDYWQLFGDIHAI